MGANVITITSEDQWAAEVAKAKEGGKVIIVDFTATWCGPCRMIGPVFDELAGTHAGGSLVFLKVDVDANANVAAQQGVTAMPTFQVIKDGEKAAELIGASKEKLVALVEQFAGAPVAA